MHQSAKDLLERRRRVMAPAYSHFYAEPLYLVRGEGAWLYDDQGRRYVDCYNNVPSVGHCHPRVVAALTRQAALLNTHTRYLHHGIIEYAEMLAATLPGDLNSCMFVCTGTEANDLAYRVARAVTGNQGIIFTANSYHGGSTLVAELSPEYGRVRNTPDWIVAVEPPFPYRGPYDLTYPDMAGAYANLVDEAIDTLRSRGYAPAMMLVDCIYDAKGIATPPPAYLQAVCRKLHAAGGLLVADEVQSGLCRLGDHTWGFEDSFHASGLLPDIVTMGKPLGDGHPLAALVTTPDIAAAFARETDYFNTFGGNPVSAAVGKAVLEVVAEENLLEHVHHTGHYLLQGLRALATRQPLIGDLRGKGLFLGVELVTDRAQRSPATHAAAAVVESMREQGVLLSRIGQHRNVLKLRPPLVFGREHADLVLAALENALADVSS